MQLETKEESFMGSAKGVMHLFFVGGGLNEALTELENGAVAVAATDCTE